MYSCNTESSSDLWNVILEYSCKAGCQVWEGTAGISCTNTDESKKYWLLMILVTSLRWVHIFRWATALKVQPKPKTSQPKKPNPPSPSKTKLRLSILLIFSLFFKRCCELPGNLEPQSRDCSHRAENRCRVLANNIKSFSFATCRTCKPIVILFLLVLLPAQLL